MHCYVTKNDIYLFYKKAELDKVEGLDSKISQILNLTEINRGNKLDIHPIPKYTRFYISFGDRLLQFSMTQSN